MTAETGDILVFTPDERDARTYASLFADALPEASIRCAWEAGQAEEVAPETEVLVGWKFPDAVFRRAKRLRWVHKLGAGVDDILSRGELPPDLILTRSDGAALAPRMAEYVLTGILALNLDLQSLLHDQAQRRWIPRRTELAAGKVVGVAGLGDIGGAVARRLAASGFRVLGWRRSPIRSVEGVEHVFCGPAEFAEFLQASDFVVLVLPSTSETRHLINSETLRHMKKTAAIVNVGRGASVDEAALVEALARGDIAAALLDVFEREPLDRDSPLWDVRNLIITPHISGPIVPQAVASMFVDNYRRYRSGAPLQRQVDLGRGY